MEFRTLPPSQRSRRGSHAGPWLLAALAVLAIGGLALATAAWAEAPPKVPGATYIGSQQCKGCHEEVAKKMEQSLHGKLLGTKLSKGSLQAQGCEGCHGPGSKHLEDPANPAFNLRLGGKGKPSPLAAADQNAVCLQCHARGKQILWHGSQHESRDVTCATCHSVHSPDAPRYQLRKATQSELCSQCHQVKAGQFSRSSHMPLKEGKLTCSSCHNVHGTASEKLVPGISVNEMCLTCHADKRGPFLWEHQPVIESCLNCHVAHSSNNQPLLKIKQPRICQTCHIASRHPSQPYGQGDRKVFSRSCVNCHFAIHGSNHPSGVYFTR